jgi:hypothetical protein
MHVLAISVLHPGTFPIGSGLKQTSFGSASLIRRGLGHVFSCSIKMDSVSTFKTANRTPWNQTAIQSASSCGKRSDTPIVKGSRLPPG